MDRVRTAALLAPRTASLRPLIATASVQPRLRLLHASALRANVPMWPNNPMPQPPVGPNDDFSDMMKDHKDKGGKGKDGKSKMSAFESFWNEWSHSPGFQAALTTIVGLIMVFGGGIVSKRRRHMLTCRDICSGTRLTCCIA